MNQILMIENKKKSKKKNRGGSGPVEIKSIVMFFAIFLIAFGVFLIGQGSYAIYREAKGSNTEDLPFVSLSRVNDTIVVDVSSRNEIEKLKYSWNNSEETVIPIGDIYVREEILIPFENSTLYITIEDVTGRAIKYAKECIVEGLDISKPLVSVAEEATDGSIKINATDETQMSYITYKVNEGEEFRIDKSESQDTTITYVLKLERGQNKVIITAVDASGNTETVEKTIIVSEKPTVELIEGDGILTIIAKDADGIKDIEVNLNGVVYAGNDFNQKEVTLPIRMEQGSNTINVKVTNINGLTVEGTAEVNY